MTRIGTESKADPEATEAAEFQRAQGPLRGKNMSRKRRFDTASRQAGKRRRWLGWKAQVVFAIGCLATFAPALAQDGQGTVRRLDQGAGSAASENDPRREGAAAAEQLPKDIRPAELSELLANPEELTSPEGLSSSLRIMLMLTVLSLAPAILLMTTSFVRIVVVLGLLRQAIGTQQLPPSQVITSLALFMTVLIMAPVWNQIKNEAIVPYTDPNQGMEWEEAWDKGVAPIKRFMSRQIDLAGNSDDVWLFFKYLPEEEQKDVPETYEEVPLKVLLPAFMTSELKTAFLIGFQVYLPFMIIDIVISSVTISMGMLMLPPAMISLPFKLMLFVLVDGWHLVIGMLLDSFAPFS